MGPRRSVRDSRDVVQFEDRIAALFQCIEARKKFSEASDGIREVAGALAAARRLDERVKRSMRAIIARTRRRAR